MKIKLVSVDTIEHQFVTHLQTKITKMNMFQNKVFEHMNWPI